MSYNVPNDYHLNFNVDQPQTYGNSAQVSFFGNSNYDQRDQFHNVGLSSLEPTAQEFRPQNQDLSLNQPSVNGAVRKTNQTGKSKYRDTRNKRNKYGSGRIFTGSKHDPLEKWNNKEEQTEVLQATASFLRESISKTPENFENGVPSQTDAYFANKKLPTNVRHNERQFKSFNRDYDHCQDRYSKNYGYRNRHNENVTGYQKLKNSDNQRFETSNRVVKSNGNRANVDNKYERSDYYESYEKNSNYERRNQVSNTKKNDNKPSYYDKRVSSHINNERKENLDNRNLDISDPYNGFKEKENNSSHTLKGGFRAYDVKNTKSEFKNRDWRKVSNFKDKNYKDETTRLNKKFDAASQRERLEGMLNRRLLECLVCCEKIRHADRVWSCRQCYHILHLSCIAAWAKSSKVENGWRCPACQNVCTDVPKQYKCYCDKATDPRYDPGIIPHGCGEICLRKGRTCDHKCTILCHPGPCPDCNIMVEKPCGCGKTKQVVKCSTDIEIVCDSVCSKILNCGIHQCKSVCHSGSCQPCSEMLKQECYCGKQGRKMACLAEFSGSTQYACEDKCGKLLSCGNHKCEKICHEGPCDICIRDVNIINTCPCGKSALNRPRTSCLDIIPCCDKICGKVLKCGQPSSPHKCRELCHEGDCPRCPLTTVVRCRCGHMDKELPCHKVTTKADDARCEKKCSKKRMCGKHKCNQRCCIEIEHFCPLPCNHQLSCGQHRCERTCHSGRCPPCIETSFEELYCECGASVLYPPIPCGTKPPICHEPCSRQRPCGHIVNHACHTGSCPPCTVLCKKWCHGHHEERSAIPCHQETFSCGLPCGKQMSCGRHKCNKPCHEGICPRPCKQPCNIPRVLCGHICGKPCHDPPCPDSNCRQNVPVTCPCGLQKSSKPCIEVAEEFRNIEMAQLKDKIGDLSKDQSVDISDLISKPKKPLILKILECTEECRVLERNRRLAIGLQIRNPDLSQKLTPKYTDFMRQWAKKDPYFCQKIHDKLTELVQLAKQSKQKSRSFSFESMNRDKRHFVHEYCEHFGVESAAYDMEPNRNVVATAIKDKSWLPGMSLLEVIQRENGQRKVPGPVSVLSKGTPSKSETVSLKLSCQGQRPIHSGEVVDYFDPPL